jgi:ABC-type ATPase involved in cell division
MSGAGKATVTRLTALEDLLAMGVGVTLQRAETEDFPYLARNVDNVWRQYEYVRARMALHGEELL